MTATNAASGVAGPRACGTLIWEPRAGTTPVLLPGTAGTLPGKWGPTEGHAQTGYSAPAGDGRLVHRRRRAISIHGIRPREVETPQIDPQRRVSPGPPRHTNSRGAP